MTQCQNKLNKILSLFCLSLCVLIICTPISLFAEGELSYPITWEAIEGAGGYLIQVQNDQHDIVMERKVTDNKITINLYPGAYSFRITTLNRFSKPEGATEWMDLQVLAQKPPTFISLSPNDILTGKQQTVIIKANNFASDGKAWIKTPAGSLISVKVKQISRGNLRVDLPILSETGKYSLIISNPPNLTTSSPDVLTVAFPKPVITNLEPSSFQLDQAPASIRIIGSDFAPQVTAVMRDEKRDIPLTVHINENSIIATLPIGLTVGDYKIIIRNSPEQEVEAIPVLKVLATPKAKPKEPTHDLLVSLGWNLLVPLDMEWSRIYDVTIGAAELGVEYYLTENRPPKPAASFNFGFRIGAMYSSFSTSPKVTDTIQKSDLAIGTIYIAPTFELAYPIIKLRLIPGIGVAYSYLKGFNALSEPQEQYSYDFFAIARLAVNIPITDWLRIELATEYRLFFMNIPMHTLAVELGAALAIPIN